MTNGRTDPQLLFLAVINLALLAVGAVFAGGAFVGLYNLQSMAGQLPEIGFLAVGVMLAMASGNGGIDLSGIALANFSGVVGALLTSRFLSPDDSPLAFSQVFAGVTIIAGMVGGAVNGLLISRLKLTPILCTLGTQLLFTGLAVAVSDGRAVTVGSPDLLSRLGNDNFLGVPISFLIFLAIALLVGTVLKFSAFGVRLMLMGTNPIAALFAGFPREGMLLTAYTLSGTMAGLAGVVIAARNVNVKWDYGQSYLLTAILIVVMAGVKPEGGYGRMTCLLLSAIALQLLSSLLNFLNVSDFFRDFSWGLLLLLFLATIRYDLIGGIMASVGAGRRSSQSPAS
ncbi:MAG: branched-chain amino acid transport system / permease component family protein [Caulobacteraceae bacterium]|nr:branched-chain amino acid transport system / permease component family protein [Caulobacteraceae bacterium]